MNKHFEDTQEIINEIERERKKRNGNYDKQK